MSKLTLAQKIAKTEGREYNSKTLRRHQKRIEKHLKAARNKPVVSYQKTRRDVPATMPKGGKPVSYETPPTASFKAHKVR